MSWHEHQPFYWILKNLTERQITNLILGLIIVIIFLGSYYIYIDTINSLKNAKYALVFNIIVILASISFIFIISRIAPTPLGFKI